MLKTRGKDLTVTFGVFFCVTGRLSKHFCGLFGPLLIQIQISITDKCKVAACPGLLVCFGISPHTVYAAWLNQAQGVICSTPSLHGLWSAPSLQI